MNIAQGTLEETRYYLILAKDLGYGNDNEFVNQLDEVSRILDSYYRTILDISA
jgi:four helix bundle protein